MLGGRESGRFRGMKRLTLLMLAVLGMACGFERGGASNPNEGRRIPVLAWGGPPAGEANVARFRELAECGFTHSFSGFPNAGAMGRALDAAHEAGVKLLVSCPELHADPEATVRRFKDHPALGGYFLQDEPSAADFAELSGWARRIEKADPDHVIYINLFPDYANTNQLGVATYQQYVDRFVKEVQTPILSFDYYPIVGASVRGSWYANLQTIRRASRDSGRPFLAFALSLPHYGYPTPTLAQLREQVYSDLAYGAQGIQYFTYWSPKGLGGGAPIDSSGHRTPVYDLVRRMNQEIRELSPVFLGSKVLWVRHTGKSIPAGTRPFEPERPIESLTTGGSGAVVSRLENAGRQYLMVVNRDIANRMPVSIKFADGLSVRQVRKDGTEKPLGANSLRTPVEPGDALLLAW